MVRKYIRKSSRKGWSKNSMKEAIEAVIKDGHSIRSASIDFKIPHATLSRKIQIFRSDPQKDINIIADPEERSFQTIFSKEQEILLCQYVNLLRSQMIALNGLDIRRLAFQLAEKCKISHRFNKDVGTAGEDWLRGFIKRNPEISIKKSETIQAFTKENVYKFFDLLESTINKCNLKANNIYNLDETLITCLAKAESTKSKNPEQSRLITAVISFSAVGTYIPLLLIFPLKISKSILKDAPRGAWAEFDANGQMQLNIFIKWLKKFIKFSKASKDSPVLLLVDGYRSYLKDLQVLQIAEKNGINIICLPPNCTDKLQPMQYSFIQTLSKAYTDQVKKWTDSNPGCSMTMDKVYKYFASAFINTSIMVDPVNCFRSTGIWPPDRNLLKEDFEDILPTKEYKTVQKELSDTKESIEKECHKTVSNMNPVNKLSTLLDSKEDSAINQNLDSNSGLSNPPSEEECQEIRWNDTPNKLSTMPNNDIQNPVIVIKQGNSQPYIVQPSGTTYRQIGEQNIRLQCIKPIAQPVFQQTVFTQPVIQQSFVINDQESIEHSELINLQNVPLKNQTPTNMKQKTDICPVVIPPEAQLTEIQIEDLQNLVTGQTNMYFYASPYRLNLTS